MNLCRCCWQTVCESCWSMDCSLMGSPSPLPRDVGLLGGTGESVGVAWVGPVESVLRGESSCTTTK